MDPRFKNRIDPDEIWCRVKNAAVRDASSSEMSNQVEYGLLQEDSDADDVSEQNDQEHSDKAPFAKRPRSSALEELFEEEDRALKSSKAAEKTFSVPERVQQEIELYRNLPAAPTSEDPLAWWWD